MNPREAAKELAIELALHRKSVRAIMKELANTGMEGVLAEAEVEVVVEKVNQASKELRGGKQLMIPMAVGMAMLMAGMIFFFLIGSGTIYALATMALGLVLILYSLLRG